MQMTQFLGDMYLELNIYDNIYDLFNKSFISPLAPFARSYYQFYLDDSTFIGADWCYKLRFVPKRSGDLVFEGYMWVHDTTYAVKRFQANIAPGANLNYIQEFYIEQEWGFPKGRKKQNETDIECALREFTEETQYKPDTITIDDYSFPYHEIFFGTNKHKYFLLLDIVVYNSLDKTKLFLADYF